MRKSLVGAQLLLMRAIGTRKLQQALDSRSDSLQAEVTHRLQVNTAEFRDVVEALRSSTEEDLQEVRRGLERHERLLAARLDLLQQTIDHVQANLSELMSQEGGRARSLHERGETLDNNIRGIQTSLERLDSIERDIGAQAALGLTVMQSQRPIPSESWERSDRTQGSPRWLPPRRPTTIKRTFSDLVPLEWRRAVRPFASLSPWKRTSTGRDIVMLVVSALRIDPRVEREARALASAGWTIIVIAPDLSQPPAADQPLDWGADVRFHLLPLNTAGYVMNAPWLVSDAMYVAAVGYKPFAYHCHDLTAMLIGLRAARHNAARFVCDHHEWYSENVTWNGSTSQWERHEPMKRLLFRWVERQVLRLADCNITVNESIARELEALGRRPSGSVRVLRNIPALNASPTRPYPPLKQQLGLSPDSFVVMYQGGTGPTRLLEPVIRALAYAPKVTFVIRGPSLDLFGEGYRAVARAAGVEDRLVLADPVPSRDVVAAARGTDVGLWSLPNLSRNFYMALPNKIFEYLAAGLPLLVADFPEAARIAEGLGVGLAFDPYDPASIAVQMNRFAEDATFLAARRAAVPVALETLDAAREWDRLCDIYGMLGKSSS